MAGKQTLPCFQKKALKVVNEAVALAEEVASDAYKMSFGEWRQRCYDVKTLADLAPQEIVDGPFAQIIRYVGRRAEKPLGSSSYDFYKICLQDHTILSTLERSPQLDLFPFCLYIVTHELIHVIRFSKFLQAFEASPEERMEEEARVHLRTREILKPVPIQGMSAVFEFYSEWEGHVDLVRDVQ